jgi:2-phospho-L-lactate guanylyltransferase
VGWTVVIPVKRLARAKSRLRGVLPPTDHADLVLAMARSTVAAALACAPVIVVSSDARVRSALARDGVSFVADPGGGLNAALRHAAALAPPSLGVAALTADVPALLSSELAAALAGCSVRSFVPDLPGTGTVLLAAPPFTELDPHFGVGSAAAHAESGAVRLDGPWPTLRRDVDTAADLEAAYALGWRPPTSGPAPGRTHSQDPDRPHGHYP